VEREEEEKREVGKEERRKGGKEERRKGGKEERRKGGKEEREGKGRGRKGSHASRLPSFLFGNTLISIHSRLSISKFPTLESSVYIVLVFLVYVSGLH
jgi:hypothetical protein